MSDYSSEKPSKKKDPEEEDVADLTSADVDDEDEDEENEQPKKKRKQPPLPTTLIPAAIAVLAFGFLAATPAFTWFYFTQELKGEVTFRNRQGKAEKKSFEGKETITYSGYGYVRARGQGTRPSGQTISEDEEKKRMEDGWTIGQPITTVAGVMAAVALCACVCLLLSSSRPQLVPTTRLTLAVAMGGAVLMLIWLVSWVIKIVVVSRKIAEERAGESEGFATVTTTYETMPGLGLWMALGCAVVAALCLSMALTNYHKKLWAYIAQGAGLLVGAGIAAALVRPWSAYPLYDALPKG